MPKSETSGVQAAYIQNWPVDGSGEPMQMISFSLSELIGLPNYSNITYKAECHRFVSSETPTKDSFRKLADELEEVMGEEREIILSQIKGQ